MNRRVLRRVLIALLTVVTVTSGGLAAKTALDYRAEAKIYEEAQDSFVTIVPDQIPLTPPPTHIDEISVEAEPPVEEETPSTEPPVVVAPVWENPSVPGIAVNFDGLTAVNDDIVSWLRIPNTAISYPLLQGENNQAYLETTYKGNHSVVGSIFMDYRNSPDLTDNNTILYGHNVSSGTMFGSLKRYRQVKYQADHPYFFLLTKDGYQRYAVCYALVTTATSSVYDYTFPEEGSYQTHLDNLASQALYDTGVTVTDQDKIVTLSTCTGVTKEERFVVVGKLDVTFPEPVKENEPPAQESEPPVQESEPPIQESQPPIQESEPPIQEGEPPIQEGEPSTQESEPPVQESESPIPQAKLPMEKIDSSTNSLSIQETIAPD